MSRSSGERRIGRKLPDAVFVVTKPPSRLVRHLTADHRLPAGAASIRGSISAHAPGSSRASMPAEGIVVRKEHIPDAVIPAFSYGVVPAIPPQNMPTVGSRLLLVTHRRTRPAAVIRVLDTLFDSRWAKAVQPPIDKGALQPAAGGRHASRRDRVSATATSR